MTTTFWLTFFLGHGVALNQNRYKMLLVDLFVTMWRVNE